MNANQWLISVGVPSLLVIVFLVWEWHSKRRGCWNGRLRRLIFPINLVLA